MNYLEQHPPLWTQPELPYLRDLLCRAYKRISEVEHLADTADIPLGTFPQDYDNLRSLFNQLIDVMLKRGNLRKMVEVAANDPTIALYQQQFQDILNAQTILPTPPPEQTDDWWKGDTSKESIATLHHERLIEHRARLFDIDLARQVAQAAKSVARLTLSFASSRASGTGFLIQPDLLLTNHHNVENLKFGKLQSVTVEFDYEKSVSSEKLVCQGKIDKIQACQKNDWAVIQLNKEVDRPIISLGTPYAISQDDHIVIIQHPLGGFKQFSLDPLSIRYMDTNVIQYVADTQKGSSGSPVFSTQMDVIALHHAEAAKELMINGVKEIEWRNEGIHISQIMDDLDKAQIPFKRNM